MTLLYPTDGPITSPCRPPPPTTTRVKRRLMRREASVHDDHLASQVTTRIGAHEQRRSDHLVGVGRAPHQTCVPHRFDLLWREVPDHVGVHGARSRGGVIHHDVDAAELFGGAANGGIDRIDVTHVGRDADRLGSHCTEMRFDVGTGIGLPAGDGHRGTGGRETLGDGATRCRGSHRSRWPRGRSDRVNGQASPCPSRLLPGRRRRAVSRRGRCTRLGVPLLPAHVVDLPQIAWSGKAQREDTVVTEPRPCAGGSVTTRTPRRAIWAGRLTGPAATGPA